MGTDKFNVGGKLIYDYSYYSGMQHSVILAAQPYGLGLNETIMPQYFKQLGYATHAVGKVQLNNILTVV